MKSLLIFLPSDSSSISGSNQQVIIGSSGSYIENVPYGTIVGGENCTIENHAYIHIFQSVEVINDAMKADDDTKKVEYEHQAFLKTSESLWSYH